MTTNHKHQVVSDIINAKSFNQIWDVEPNKHDNKYSRNEFKGLYAFAAVNRNKVDFRYIGISQTIRRRFAGHVKRKTRQEATWAYLMAKCDFPDLDISNREEKIPIYQREIIYPLKFTFHTIDDNMLMHMAEVYCVNKLKAYWNTFETH